MKIFLLTIAALLVLSITCLGAPFEDDTLQARPDRFVSRIALSIGTPGGLNLCFSHWGADRLGFRLTGGYVGRNTGHTAGGQAEMILRFHEGGRTIEDVSVGVGRSEIYSRRGDFFWYSGSSTKTWTYIGGFYNLNSHAFFLQVGLTFGSGAYSSPQIGLQIGVSLYSWRTKEGRS
jgi:hypothetical protein